MNYYLFIWSIATFIEERIKEGISFDELEAAVGFSYRHIKAFPPASRQTVWLSSVNGR